MASEKINSFTRLIAWQESHKLVVQVLIICSDMPKYGALRDQLERSAISITSNIAEGFGRQSVADKKHFYVVARGSAFELQNQLIIARDMRLVSEEQFESLAQKSISSTKLIHGLIRSLSRSDNASS